MQMLSRNAGRLILALALAAPVAAQAQPAQSPAAPVAADPAKDQQQRSINQPGNNAPVWREVRSGQPNYTSIPGREVGVLVQPQARFPGQGSMTTAGEAWRNFRNGPITFYGGWLVLLACAAIATIYFTLGPIKLHDKPSGRTIERFTLAERWAHWTTAISFCVLGVSGLIILFGKYVLLPVIGYTLFAWLTSLAKNLHNFVAPLFIVSLLVFIVMYVKDNLPEKGDFAWLANGWKMFRGEHMPSGRFNAGEKAWFWGGVVALSLVICTSGLVLLFPNFEQLRATMQQASVVHSIAALLVIAAAIGHIYMGTIGMEGAYQNMRDGVADETWAKEHHELWYNDVKSGKPAAKSGAGPQASAQTQH
ncbi:MAG TPA: formate dehydrogenase subunit gamma [Burkholderiales bacterium]|nr:formate dehydrogenase subunit gamma [Burkholderiales bacterium]